MIKTFFILVVITLAVIFLPDLLMGQAPPPMPDKPIDQAPIDGGLALLAAAGGAYGIKKMRNKKESSSYPS